MRICFVNSVFFGSTGRLMQQLASCSLERGDIVALVVANSDGFSFRTDIFQVAPKKYNFVLEKYGSKVLGNDGFCNKKGTKSLIRFLEKFQPDIIHLNNPNGGYLNFPSLLSFSKKYKVPIVWTLHDAWVVTGRCCYFEYNNCDKWQTGCHCCRHWLQYPQTLIPFCESRRWKIKRSLVQFNPMLTLVSPSLWLRSILERAGFQDRCLVINNGVDLKEFSPRKKDERIVDFARGRFVIGSVSSKWTKQKGVRFLIELCHLLDPKKEVLVVVGSGNFPTIPNLLVIPKTNSTNQLASLYSTFDVFVNCTLEDNYPTVNLEALACGTPLVAFQTGGASEAIKESENGFSVKKGDITEMLCRIRQISEKRLLFRKQALSSSKSHSNEFFCQSYLNLYDQIYQKMQSNFNLVKK
jgi:putative colanic acid biosynthesis glycosyltransferase